MDLGGRLNLIIQLLDAIAVAHRHLVVHCDLKYANVLVTDGGLVQVLDFGIAKLLNPSQYGFVNPLTKAFRPLTPEFASPEELNGQPLTTSVDLYSTGVRCVEARTRAIARVVQARERSRPRVHPPAPRDHGDPDEARGCGLGGRSHRFGDGIPGSVSRLAGTAVTRSREPSEPATSGFPAPAVGANRSES